MKNYNSEEMKRVKKNIRNLDRFVSVMPESNEKELFKQIYITLDNMRKLIGTYKFKMDYIGDKHNSRLVKLEKTSQT